MTKMAIQEASFKCLIVVLTLLQLANGEPQQANQRPNEPPRRSLTKRHHHEKDFPPRLTHQPHSTRVKPQEPLTVECPVESQPESEVKWFKDGQVLASEPAHLDQTGRELMFFQTSLQDTGDYHCEADNYLGRVASEPFRLTVQSNAIQDESILMEPQVYLAADRQEWPAEFRCTIPVSLLGRTGNLWQTSRPEQFVKWHRNGRPLTVYWAHQQEPASGAEIADQWAGQQRGFTARRNDRKLNEFVLSLLRPTRQLDNNSTFTCLLKWDEELAAANEAYESHPAQLRFEPAHEPVKLDATMGQPIDMNNNQHTIHLADRERNRTSAETNRTTQPPSGDEDQNNDASANNGARIRSFWETLADLYQIAKPTLILFGVMCLVAVVVSFQFLFMRRRAQAHRYMKHHHHQYSSSASSANSGLCGGGGGQGSGGSGTSSALGDCDPVLSSLLARTLSAPSAGSLSGASKKYKYYRDHMRGKVAAAADHQLVDGAHHDFIDAAAFFAATHQQQQDCQANLFAPSSNNNSAVPNLYNQSLAAREQARSLLQGGEHVRSMGNLTASGQLQRLEHPLSKQHDMIMSGTQRPNQQHHQLELPINFANSYNTGCPLELGAASLLQQQPIGPTHQQQPLWHSQHHLLLAAAAQQQQQQSKQANPNEQYQLVSCSSISPSSTSSIVAGSNSSSGTANIANVATNQHSETTTSQFKGASNAVATRDSISNHYSIIENNDELEDREEDERYEELDDREFKRSSARSSAASSSAATNKLTSIEHKRDFNRKTTFGVDTANNNNNNISERGQRKSSSQLRSSIVSNESSSSSSASTGNRRTNAFGSKRTSIKANQRRANQDQLSPYAVSSICHNQQQPPPPPMSSEAMRALKEQFDINQLVLIDNGRQSSSSSSALAGQLIDSTARIPFNLPPPPPDCDNMSMSETMANDRSMPGSKAKRER